MAGTYLAPGATQASDLTFTANAAKTVFTATVAVDPTGLEAADKLDARVRANARDVAGNPGAQAEKLFRVDTLAVLTQAWHTATAPLGVGKTFQVAAQGEPGATVTAAFTLKNFAQTPLVLTERPVSDTKSLYLSDAVTVAAGDLFNGKITVSMRDKVGNTKSLETSTALVIDTLPPAPVLVAPTPGTTWLKSGESVLLKADPGAEGSSLVVTAEIAAGTQALRFPMTYNPATQLFEVELQPASFGALQFAPTEVTLAARDRAGNVNPTPIRTGVQIGVDTVAPNVQVSMAVPQGGQGKAGWLVRQPELTVLGDADIATIFYIMTDPSGVKPEATYTGKFTATGTATGTYSLEVWAVDQAGNAGIHRSVSYRFDGTAPAKPVVTVRKADNSPITALVNERQVKVSVSTEPGAFVAMAATGGRTALAQANETGLAEGVLVLPEGNVSVSARAYDAAGNESAAADAVEFAIDTTRPQFTIAEENGTVTVTVTEALQGGEPTVLVNGQAQAVTAHATAANTFTFTLAGGGNFKIQAAGTDLAGNQGKGVKVVEVVSQIDQETQISSDDSSVNVTIPAGALPETGKIEVNAGVATRATDTGMEAALQIALNYKRDSSNQETTFLQPVTAVFRVPVPAGVDPTLFRDSLKLMLWKNNAWVEVTGTDASIRSRNLVGDYVDVTVQFHHFSDWQFAGDVTPPALTVTSPATGTTVGPKSPSDTTATGLRISGTTEAGATVKVSLGAAQVATGTVSATGSFTADVPWASLTEGAAATLTVEAKDTAGNAATQSVTVTKDSIVNGGLTVSTVAPARTNATSLTLAGTTEPGATVSVTGGAATATTTADATGAFSLTVSLRSTAGQDTTNSLTVTAADAMANTATRTVSLVQDARLPIIAANLAAVITARTADFTVTTDEAAVVTPAGAGATFTPAASAQGTSHTFHLDLGAADPGDHFALTFAAQDAAGNTAAFSHSLTYNPSVPTLTATTPARTKNRDIVVNGTTVAGGNLEVSLDGGNVYTQAGLADDAGAFSVAARLPDADGSHTVHVRVTDLNTGAINTFSVSTTLDRTPPAISGVTPVTGSTVADTVTQVTVSATVNEPARFTVKRGGVTVYTGNAPANSLETTVSGLEIGANVIEITATDDLGNAASATLTVTRQAPPAPPGGGGAVVQPPVVVAPTVTLDSPADRTFVKTPLIAVTGSATPAGSATVSLTVNGTSAGAVTVGAGGRYSFMVTLTEGANTLTVTATAPSATSTASASAVVTLDTQVPALQVTAPAETTAARETVVITTERNATVSINGQSAGQANAAGRLEVTVDLRQGTNTFLIQATDAAGNSSEAKAVSITRKAPPSNPGTDEPSAPAQVADRVVPGTETSLNHQGFTVNVPRHSFTRPVQMVVADAALTGIPVTGYQLVRAADVTARPEGESQRGALRGELTLSFTYDLAALNGINPLELRIFYWNQALSAWVPLPTRVDTATGTVSAVVDHLTTFAVMAPAEKTPTLRNVPGFTFDESLTVQGSGAPGAEVTVAVNGKAAGTGTVGQSGDFAVTVPLERGTNTILAVVKQNGVVRATAETRVLHASASQLTDISAHWAKGSVYQMVARGVTTGFEDSTFRPEEQVTRAQFVAFLLRALGYEADTAPALAFSDRNTVPEWAAGWLSRAVALGLITGYSDNTIRPDAPITRAEMAVLIDRALAMKSVKTGGTEKSFTDADRIPAWANTAVARAARLGLITGYSDNSFGPDKLATRAEALVIIQRFLDLR
ncbi:MAG TPA: S-layer homology domain-containing protein [Symbiobacteriaceae bacterium]|nr:S-layer homology domain-containing protein [Symbiobacteriaceae bacterium]